MQNFTFPHAAPAGPSFSLPRHPMQPPMGPAAPLPGGPTHLTRVRWGRLAVAAIGVALLVFGAWNGVRSTTSGGGTAPSRDAGSTQRDLDVTPQTGDLTRRAAAPTQPTRRAAPVRRNRALVPGAGQRRSARPAAQATLPYTGAETWVFAGLGILLLGGGVAMQVNAVRIGMVAMLYRRGILLRPVECARLAQDRGLPRARVLLSAALERLLAEPGDAGYVLSGRMPALPAVR